VDSPALAPQVVIAVDPGQMKCGLAVVRADGTVLRRGIVSVEEIGEAVREMGERFSEGIIVLGDRTGARSIRRELEMNTTLPIALVAEHRSTIEGRRRYFRENPPRGWRRLLPTGLQTPPVPIDDYVAVILAERYFAMFAGG
jgi:RNase H-fold protein (predicted Holliday junction resolvase)